MSADWKERAERALRATSAGRWLLAIAVGGSALAVGAVHTRILCVVAAAVTLATFATWWQAEPLKARSSATLLLFTGLGLTVYTAVQCLPLPSAVLAVVAPHNADVWSRALSPLHESGPAWAPISLDPTATRVEFLKGVTYTLAFVTSLRIARKRDGIAFLSGVLVLTGALLAVSALLHPAFGAHRLFGIYEPSNGIAERHIAPLMNPNHLAAYLNISFCVALAASLSPRSRVPRIVWAALAVVLAATQVWVASRGGVVAMMVGAAIILVLSRVDRSASHRKPTVIPVLCGAAAMVGAIMVVFGTSDQVSGELLDSNVSKLELVRQALRMLAAYPIFGTGRGAFESTFPAFRDYIDQLTPAGHVTFSHPENIVAQWLVEWGAPVGVLAFASIGFALRPSSVLARSATARGAWGALVATAVQNLGDFNTETPGVMIAAVVCGAIVVGGDAGTEPASRLETWAQRPRHVATGAVWAGAVAIVVAVLGVPHELARDRERLHRAAEAEPLDRSVLESAARAAILRHPAEPYLPFIVAWAESHNDRTRAVAWIGATLDRARAYGPAHLVLARALFGLSPAQARLEYRLAVEQAPELLDVVTREGSQLVNGYDDAMELVSASSRGTGLLRGLATLVRARLPATAVRLDAALAARSPQDSGPVLRAATDAVADLTSEDAPWCDQPNHDQCVQTALQLSRRLEQLQPATCAGFVLEARTLLAVDEPRAAMDLLARSADQVNDRSMCLRALAQTALGIHDAPRADLALDALAHSGCESVTECLDNLLWIAQMEENRGRSRRALAMYLRACDLVPDNDSLAETAARFASAHGLHADAAEQYEHLAAKHPGVLRWRQAAEAERQTAVRSALTDDAPGAN